MLTYLKKWALLDKERFFIIAVSIGSLLEWHEIFLYIYWAPILSEPLFQLALPAFEILNMFLLLATAWIARPLGGVFFGYVGDRFGRKNAFILSMILISLPSILTAVVSSLFSWGVFTLFFFAFMRFIQGVPAGGEVPGAICYFAEISPHRKTYISSYVFVGPQIGQITAMAECLLLQKHLPHDALLKWGWKLSFLVGGILGLLGYFLRRKLHESQAFQNLKHSGQILKSPILTSFKYHWKDMLLCFGISLYEVIGFFLVAIFPVENFSQLFDITPNKNILINVYLLLLATILLPFIGGLIKPHQKITLLKQSSIASALLAIPLYFALSTASFYWTVTIQTLMIFSLCISFATFPSLIAELFPINVRYSCIGFSFNICDSLIVGMAPLFIHFLTRTSGTPAIFVLLLPLSALLFLPCLHLLTLRKSFS